MIQKIKFTWTDYLLIFLLVANSGFPFFYRYIEWIAITTVIAFLIATKRKVKLTKFFIVFLFITSFITIGQILFAGISMPLQTLMGLYLRIICAYLIFQILGTKLPNLYINLIYTFSIISFLFYFPSILFPGFANYLIDSLGSVLQSPFYNETAQYNSPNNIILFEFNAIKDFRNSGPFWEPGAFGGFLIIALLWNLMINPRIINRQNLVFTIAILTTISTTAYIALFTLILLHQLLIARKMKIVYTIPFIIIVGFLSFTEFSFLKDKIDYQLEKKTIVDIHSSRGRSRFASAALDLQDLKRSPVFGVSKSTAIRYKDKNLNLINIHRNNGITLLLAQYGVFYFLFYFYFLYKGFRNYALKNNTNPSFGFIAIITFLLIGFSESYFQYIFFIGLIFFHLNYKTFKIANNNSGSEECAINPIVSKIPS